MIFFILVCSVLLTLLLYTRVKDVALYILRACAIALLLLFATDFLITSFAKTQSRLIVAVDASRSMSLPYKAHWLRAQLHELSQKGVRGLQYVQFHGSVYEFDPSSNPEYGDMTDVARVLSEADMAPVLLLSDGLHNVPGNPVQAAERRRFPVYVVYPDTFPEERNVSIAQVESDRLILEGGKAALRVRIQVRGGEGYSGALTLYESGKELKKQIITVGGDSTLTVNLEVSPRGLGNHYYEIHISEMPGESFLGDNTKEVGIKVIRGLYQGVVLAAHPSPMIGAIRRLVSRYPRLDCTYLVKDKEHGWKEWGSDIAPWNGDTFAADFAILIDPDMETLQLARRFSKDKREMLIFLGRNYRSLHGELGLLTGQAKIIEKEVDLTPTPYLLDLISAPRLEVLSPLRGVISTKLPEGAVPLLVSHSVRMGGRPYPVLSLIRGGQEEVVLSSGLRMWELSLYSPEIFSKLIGGVITYFMRQHNEYICETDKSVYFSGEPVILRAYAYDETGEPLDDVFAEISFQGHTEPLRYQGPGRFVSSPLFFEPGDKEIPVIFKRGGKVVAEQNLTFRVRPGSLEAAETGIDTVLLREIALASGGAVLAHASDALHMEAARQREAASFKPNKNLIFLLSFIGFLTLEGWLRKRKGLL